MDFDPDSIAAFLTTEYEDELFEDQQEAYCKFEKNSRNLISHKARRKYAKRNNKRRSGEEIKENRS